MGRGVDSKDRKVLVGSAALDRLEFYHKWTSTFLFPQQRIQATSTKRWKADHKVFLSFSISSCFCPLLFLGSFYTSYFLWNRAINSKHTQSWSLNPVKTLIYLRSGISFLAYKWCFWLMRLRFSCQITSFGLFFRVEWSCSLRFRPRENISDILCLGLCVAIDKEGNHLLCKVSCLWDPMHVIPLILLASSLTFLPIFMCFLWLFTLGESPSFFVCVLISVLRPLIDI